MLKKDSKLYKGLLSIYVRYLKVYHAHKNRNYKKVVTNLIKDNSLEEKISELKNLISAKDDVTYYIIRRENKTIGLLTYVSVFMGHIAYAISKGYVPIIDMKNHKSIYLTDDEVGKLNAWELFFQQPFGLSLDDINANSNIILSPKYLHPLSPDISSLYNEDEKLFWRHLAKEFVRLNRSTENYFKEEYDSLLKNKKVLGLLYRGTDYISLKPKFHPVQPSADLFVKTIKKCLKQWGDYDGFYLATDEEKMVNILKKEFPEKIIVNLRQYYDNLSNIRYLSEASFDRENDEFLKGLEYLSSIKLLSTADSIVAGMCAGTYSANFFKEKDFSHAYYFNLGLY